MPRPDRLKPRNKPRQRRSQETVEAILVAAAQVFEAEGYARGTTDRIAARAGVSVGSLYQYFPGKDAILVALAERHAEAGAAMVRARLSTAPTSPRDLDPWLRGLVEALLALHEHQPRLQHMLLEGLPLPADLHDRFVASEAALSGAIATLLQGIIAPRPLPRPLAAAWVLLHAIQGLVHDYALHRPDGVSREELIDEVVLLVRGRVGA